MTIKQLLSLLAFSGFLQNTFAQNQPTPCQLVEAATKTARETNSTAPFDELLENGTIKKPKYQAWVITLRAQQRFISNRTTLSESKGAVNFSENPAVQAILADYEKAIAVSPDYKIVVQRYRYAFLTKMGATETKLAQQDLIDLKAGGYREKQAGMGLFAQVVQGQNTWIGGGLSLGYALQPAYKLRNPGDTARIVQSRQKSRCLSAFELNYARNLAHPMNDFALQLLRINAPIVLAPAHFGVVTGKTSEGVSVGRRWYYNPEIGWGYNGFSVSYGYRLMFKKGNFDGREGHLFKLRYTTIL
jgi:hypothetical protein